MVTNYNYVVFFFVVTFEHPANKLLVDLLIVGGQRGFKMGYIVESPERAREAMREAVLSVTVRR